MAADPPAPMRLSDPAPSTPQDDRPPVAWPPEAPSSHPYAVAPEARASVPGEPTPPFSPPGEASSSLGAMPGEAFEATAQASAGEPPQAAPAAPDSPAIAEPVPHAVLREPPGWPAPDPAGEPSRERDRGVSIGQIDVVVESPEPARPRSSARPSRSDGTSRHYLRRLR